jgi:cytosine/adenosine deaminase-related metal-dependent hydrolase
MKAFRADWICPVGTPAVSDACLVVSDGRVVEVASEAPADARTERFNGCAIVPGFVNAHTHLELTLFRGFLEGLRFHEWIRVLTKTKYALDRDALILSARLGAAECLAAGVTTIGEVMDIGTGWEAMAEYGLRGLAWQEVFGPAPEAARDAVRSLGEKMAARSEATTALCRLGVSPHAPYSVSEPLYRAVADQATREQWPVAMHIAESVEEGRFVREGAGVFADGWKRRGIDVPVHGVGPMEYVDRLGLLGPCTLAIHAIDVSAEEIGRLRETGTAVAHCPTSNLKLGHGIAPLREFLDQEIPVGLGTDSVASNNAVDMFQEMRLAAYLQASRLNDPGAVSATEALKMATLGGARCLGLDTELGSLEPGKLADFVVVDLDTPATRPVYDPVETLVFSASRANVRATYLAGVRVEIDSEELRKQAQALVPRLLDIRSRS